MRQFSVPERYEQLLEVKISAFVEEIRLDIYRRAHGHKPVFPDFMIHSERTGVTMALVGTPAPEDDDRIEQIGAAIHSAIKARRTA